MVKCRSLKTMVKILFSKHSLHWYCFSKRVIIAKRSKNPFIELKLNCRVASTSRFWAALYKAAKLLCPVLICKVSNWDEYLLTIFAFGENAPVGRAAFHASAIGRSPIIGLRLLKTSLHWTMQLCCIVYCLPVSRCRRFCRAKTIGSGLCSRKVFRKFYASFKVD